MKRSAQALVTILFVFFALLTITATTAYSSVSVIISWDANDPAPEGYRVYGRADGDSYNYDSPLKDTGDTSCTIAGLSEGETYYFVVRAYEGELDGEDSDEVSYTVPVSETNNENNGDTGSENGSGDNTGDDGNASGDTGSENGSGDNTGDDGNASGDTGSENGSGDNTGDDGNASGDTGSENGSGDNTGDDGNASGDTGSENGSGDNTGNDGNASGDTGSENGSGDNTGNNGNGSGDTGSENDNGDNSGNDGNTNGDSDTETVTATERVELTPVLVRNEYFGTEDETPYQTRWQISTEESFATLILDATSTVQIYTYQVGEMLLDTDTVYYWRARFIDSDGTASDWSETNTFTTVTAESAGDADSDGVQDNQETGEATDVNQNGVADGEESNIMTVNSVDSEVTLGVQSLSDSVSLVSVKSISADEIADDSINLGFGLVGFKLYLDDGVTTASVKIHFTEEVPANAKLYKYTTESGWFEYENATFAADGKSVTLVLEDGGAGDEDGVVNGVIVDPSGIAYDDETESTDDEETSDTDNATAATLDVNSASAGGSGGGGGCFISSCGTEMGGMNVKKVLIIFLLAGVVLATGKALIVKK